MATKFDATVKAVENADSWMNGAVVLELEGGEHEAYPGAYLTDASFTEEWEKIVVDLTNGVYGSTGYSPDEATAEEIAELILNG